MKKWIALVCAGMMIAALSGCSQPAGTASTEAKAEATATQSETAAEASADESAAATETVSTEPSATESAASTASAEASSVASAAAEVSGAAGGEIDSAAATQIAGLLESGNFTAALEAAKEAGAESLATQLQALSEAAEECNVTIEPNSGDTIVYGDDATVVDGTTNIIPFVDLTHDYAHLQLGFVDPASESQDAAPTSVELTTEEGDWSWEATPANSVALESDVSKTWVLETALTGADLNLLSAVGSAAPGSATVQFVGPDGNRDYTLSDAEIGAFGHMGTFTSALQTVRQALAA